MGASVRASTGSVPAAGPGALLIPRPIPSAVRIRTPVGEPARHTSGLAIGALVTGLVGLGPIAVGLGIGALLTARRTRESGTGMAIARSCDTSHAGEVFATLVLAPRPYPGDRAVRDEAEEACDRQFKEYVGVDVHASELDSDYVYPSRDMWETGERDVMCLAYGPDGETLDRTVKDSKR